MPTKQRISPFWKQCFVTLSVGSNIIGHGCAIGYPAVLLPQLAQPGADITITVVAASWIASVLGITHLLGSFITPPIMSRCGRKAAHLAATMPVLIGWFIIMSATSFKALLIGRILHGFSIGMLSPLRSVLIGEYTSPKNRGAFLTTVSLAQSFGIFFVHLIGSFVSWQQTALICVFFSFASLVMGMYLPESPCWLVCQGKYDECREVFRWLRGDGEEEELEEMIKARILFENARIYQNTQKQNSDFQEMLETIQKKEFYKPILIMVHAFLMVQFAGSTTFAAYSTTILGLVMGPDANHHFWMVFLDTQRLIANSLVLFIINKLKRRTMLFLAGGLCVLSQLLLAAYTYCKSHDLLPYDHIWIPAVLINIHYFTVGSGMLPLPGVIGGEVFPLEYKSIGGTISLSAMSVSFFVVLKTFSGLVDNYGIHTSYVVYAALLTYCLVLIWFILPETKDKTLQQIEDEFRGRPLTYYEMQSRLSLQACPVVAYNKQKMSMIESQPLRPNKSYAVLAAAEGRETRASIR